ncbi:uncharacterized protein [Porites lutea]|uniref:uncharacterized protein isoform X2 n=1 Tax=Porites lutea TaxID=51062 RepID=UPI003CC68777
MFANFTPRVDQLKRTREQLERSLNLLIETRNDLRSFLDDECTTSEEWRDFQMVSERVDQLNASAVQLTERANSKLQIAFVGSVSAGKSTLINTLLGENIMPVTRGETSFCNVAISGTMDDQWKAIDRRSGKTLDITEFKQLLHVLKAKDKRERLGITPSSIIDVKWPSSRAKALVESVVLYDTPGIGERKDTDDAVIDLCKTVDVIIAVMDIHSPTLRTIETTPTHSTQFTSSKSADETEGSKGFEEFERNLIEASKGALKFDTLKYDLQKFVEEAKTQSANLGRIMDQRKQQRIQRVSRRMRNISDAETTINTHLSQISGALIDVMGRLQQDRELRAFKDQIERDLRNRVSTKNALERCRDGLNQRLQEMVEQDRELKTHLDEIWNCLTQVADGPGRLSLQLNQPMWRSEDFQLNENSFQDNSLRSCLVNPSLPARMICYGLLGAMTVGGNAALFSAVGVPVLNSVLPCTDVSEWLKYVWPTSDQEIKAVQDFFVNRLRNIHQEKTQEVEIDGISGLKETSNLRIRGVKRSLEDDLRFIQDGDNFLNKRIRVTDTLQNTFEGFEDKVQDI